MVPNPCQRCAERNPARGRCDTTWEYCLRRNPYLWPDPAPSKVPGYGQSTSLHGGPPAYSQQSGSALAGSLLASPNAAPRPGELPPGASQFLPPQQTAYGQAAPSSRSRRSNDQPQSERTDTTEDWEHDWTGLDREAGRLSRLENLAEAIQGGSGNYPPPPASHPPPPPAPQLAGPQTQPGQKRRAGTPLSQPARQQPFPQQQPSQQPFQQPFQQPTQQPNFQQLGSAKAPKRSVTSGTGFQPGSTTDLTPLTSTNRQVRGAYGIPSYGFNMDPAIGSTDVINFSQPAKQRAQTLQEVGQANPQLQPLQQPPFQQLGSAPMASDTYVQEPEDYEASSESQVQDRSFTPPNDAFSIIARNWGGPTRDKALDDEARMNTAKAAKAAAADATASFGGGLSRDDRPVGSLPRTTQGRSNTSESQDRRSGYPRAGGNSGTFDPTEKFGEEHGHQGGSKDSDSNLDHSRCGPPKRGNGSGQSSNGNRSSSGTRVPPSQTRRGKAVDPTKSDSMDSISSGLSQISVQSHGSTSSNARPKSGKVASKGSYDSYGNTKAGRQKQQKQKESSVDEEIKKFKP